MSPEQAKSLVPPPYRHEFQVDGQADLEHLGVANLKAFRRHWAGEELHLQAQIEQLSAYRAILYGASATTL